MPNMKAAAQPQPRQEEPQLEPSDFQALVEAAGSAIIAFDRTGHIREFNPAAERLHGCQRHDVLGKRYLDLFVPEEKRASLRRDVLKAESAGLGRNFEITIDAHDGCTRVIAWNGARLRDENDTPAGMIVIGQDVTARREAEHALRESERRFRELAEAAPVLVWMADVNYQCTYVNQAWLEFTGLPCEEFLGDGWTDLIHPEDREARFPAYTEAILRHVEFTLDHRLRAADGSYPWIFGRASPRFEADGAFAGFVGCSIDITERRRAEKRCAAATRSSSVASPGVRPS